jgi:hypothetical protein
MGKRKARAIKLKEIKYYLVDKNYIGKIPWGYFRYV